MSPWRSAYEGVSKSFRTGRLERELQMVQLPATSCSCIAILWASVVNFAAITLCVASQRVFIVVISLWLSPETFGYILVSVGTSWLSILVKWQKFRLSSRHMQPTNKVTEEDQLCTFWTLKWDITFDECGLLYIYIYMYVCFELFCMPFTKVARLN
jgi:hypothetical protein